ncbi:MAG TPA: hypothetical protein VNU66_03170 [Mycobacteriales bacterium]|nr:hypothetical protein [Mycobacteriales bacterium]
MRRLVLSVSAVALAATALPGLASGPAAAELVQKPLGVGGFMSENVSYVGTLPIAPGIGGRVLTVDGQQRLYMTGSQGLYVFDVDDPALPVPLGFYHLPHFQNEDVDVSDDGKRVIISTDTAGADRNGSTANGIHVLDTSNLGSIRRVGFINQSNHTTTCADAKCEWLYGSGGRIYDATNPASIKHVGEWKPAALEDGTRVSGGHALNRDESGLMISDTNPRLVLDVTDPAAPVVVASGAASVQLPDGLLQHNNVRLGATEWQAREEGDDDPALRPGELFIGNSESNLRTQCGSNAGGLSSWSMKDFDKGAPLEQREVFRPVNGSIAEGNPAVNALGCSGHWFTVRDGMIAASWYEHGVRFIDVDSEGAFTQKGYFQPVVTEAGAAHWIPGPDGSEYVYSMDYARGIDILKFDRGGEVPTQEQFDASWMANLGSQGVLSIVERNLCRAAMEGHDAHVAAGSTSPVVATAAVPRT